MYEIIVSVIVATYRRSFELARALKSLEIQTYKNFEIIIIDDNADYEWNSVVTRVVSSFMEKNCNVQVKYIKNCQNQGSAKSRNIGIQASEGSYICFLDDDDLYFPDKIKNQLQKMENVNADYSITNLALYSENEKLIEIRNRDYILETSTEALMKYHFMYHLTGTDTMMFRKEYLLKIGCFSLIDLGDEFYLMKKAIEGKGTFVYVPVCDVKAYVHSGESGLSSGMNKIQCENQLFEYKSKYFDQFDVKTVNYIKMRHYAVLAFAYLRMNQYKNTIDCVGKSFFLEPVGFVKLLINRIR